VPKSESEVLADVLLAGTSATTRLSRNNSGALVDRNGRLVRFGLFSPGGSDAVGFVSIVITEAMVGRRIAIYAEAECKAEKGGRVSEDQARHQALVRDFGGIAGVVRSADEARELLGIDRG